MHIEGKNNYRFKVSILIVTYNNASTINRCLESLRRQESADFEILVKDNASVDETEEILAKYENIKVFTDNKNLGFGAAMNYLAKMAEGEFLFILNPDCECPENTLARLYEFGRNHGGAISPALKYPDNSLQVSARNFPDFRRIVFSRRSPLFQLGLFKTGDAGYIKPDHPAKVPAISATAMFIGKNDFESVDGFDERFFMYLEDIDLCRRLNSAEIDVWYLPDIQIKHVLGASSSTTAFKSSFHHHLSIYKYFTKHFPGKYIRNSFLAILLFGGLMTTILMKLLGFRRRQ
ncbi:MAG: glycosyltransferase family 2 protein [candidate division Zixibacteria bacterium]|nr:glycosyltransferase family 2 protein [candidate division Zixibacteria bacterium]